jgi:hypothetical protein
MKKEYKFPSFVQSSHSISADYPRIQEKDMKVDEVRQFGIENLVLVERGTRNPVRVQGFSTRPDGASVVDRKPTLNLGFTEWDDRERVSANRRKFITAIGDGKEPLIRQFHSDVIHVSAEPSADFPKADALITRTPGPRSGYKPRIACQFFSRRRSTPRGGRHSCWVVRKACTHRGKNPSAK